MSEPSDFLPVPKPAGFSGKDASGRFLPGNKAGKGNPLNRKAQQLRASMLRAVTRADVYDIFRALIEQAKSGDTSAAKLILEQVLGRPHISLAIEAQSSPLSDDERREYLARFFGLRSSEELELP